MLAIDRIWAEMRVFYRIDFAVLAHLVRSPDFIGTVITRSCGAGWVGDFTLTLALFSFSSGRAEAALGRRASGRPLTPSREEGGQEFCKLG